MAGDASEEDGSGVGEVKSSTVLQGDLGEIKEKISKYQTRRELSEYPEVKGHGDAVVECYRCANGFLDILVRPYSPMCRQNSARPLDCWREVDRFKNSVAKLEHVRRYISTHYFYRPLISLRRNTSRHYGNTLKECPSHTYMSVMNTLYKTTNVVHYVRPYFLDCSPNWVGLISY